MEQEKKTFIEMLPKIYGMYTGGFIAFIILMAILEQMGLGADTIGILFVVFTVLVYAGIGWLSRTMQVEA
jgi:cation/acetate symporter